MPSFLPVYAAHTLYAAIIADPVILRTVENLPLYEEDVISQELVRLFMDIAMVQRYHHMSAPSDLPAALGMPLRLALSDLPGCLLSILHLHGFGTFVKMLPPNIIYPTFR